MKSPLLMTSATSVPSTNSSALPQRPAPFAPWAPPIDPTAPSAWRACFNPTSRTKYVQEVMYRDYAADEHGNAVDAVDQAPLDVGYGPTVKEPLEKAFKLAAHLTGLTSLRFVFHPKSPRDVNPISASLHLQRVLLVTIGNTAPHLRSLTLTNLTPAYHLLYAMPAFQRALSHLTDLRISTASPTDLPTHSDMWGAMARFWYYGISQHVFESLENVVSLVVASDMPTAVKISLRGTLPRLKYLVVRNVGVDIRHPTVNDFVRRHALLEWIDIGKGPEGVRGVRHTHADPQDETECEVPPSMAA
ncbi:hypothetical protein FA95DRAFT_827633 [Auriscalpium vulgare]|uniref:Uncharacterized protein n=1 Tax=Auriscalpium vulgare TaxID=40419 RepID=A0ACB8R9W6_9AGAM|nr:hypothetical protein FA95DRAFT_827633 [Auriscalpium vulgare]